MVYMGGAPKHFKGENMDYPSFKSKDYRWTAGALASASMTASGAPARAAGPRASASISASDQHQEPVQGLKASASITEGKGMWGERWEAAL